MLEPLANHFGTKLTVVCNELSAPVYENSPHVGEIVTFSRERALTDDAYLTTLVRRLESTTSDVVLNSVYSRDALSDLVAVSCNGQTKIAFHGDLCNQSAEQRSRHNAAYSNILPSETSSLSELSRHKEFLKGLGIATPELRPVLHLTSEEISYAQRFYAEHGLDPARTFILGPMSQCSIKAYPGWAEVLSNVCDSGGLSALVLGASVDADPSERILDGLKGRYVNMCGKTTLRESAALIAAARFVLAVDTSIPHIATALGVPNVVILGGGHFGRFFPYSSLTSVVCLPLECYGCDWRCGFAEAHCVTGIQPEVVVQAVRQTLRTASAKPRVFMQGSRGWNAQIPAWHGFEKWLDPSTVELISVGSA
jgi:ADP-heptose:LPS heptosyltransferase